jgi:hypothetical protein
LPKKTFIPHDNIGASAVKKSKTLWEKMKKNAFGGSA